MATAFWRLSKRSKSVSKQHLSLIDRPRPPEGRFQNSVQLQVLDDFGRAPFSKVQPIAQFVSNLKDGHRAVDVGGKQSFRGSLLDPEPAGLDQRPCGHQTLKDSIEDRMQGGWPYPRLRVATSKESLQRQADGAENAPRSSENRISWRTGHYWPLKLKRWYCWEMVLVRNLNVVLMAMPIFASPVEHDEDPMTLPSSPPYPAGRSGLKILVLRARSGQFHIK